MGNETNGNGNNIERLFGIIEKQAEKNADFLRILGELDKRIIEMDADFKNMTDYCNKIKEILTDDQSGIRPKLSSMAAKEVEHNLKCAEVHKNITEKLECFVNEEKKQSHNWKIEIFKGLITVGVAILSSLLTYYLATGGVK